MSASIHRKDENHEEIHSAREAGEEMADAIEKARRIVVGGNRAVVIFPDKSWKNLERVGGEWKIDD